MIRIGIHLSTTHPNEDVWVFIRRFNPTSVDPVSHRFVDGVRSAADRGEPVDDLVANDEIRRFKERLWGEILPFFKTAGTTPRKRGESRGGVKTSRG